MSWTKQAALLALCQPFGTYVTAWAMYGRPPLPGAWVLTGITCLIFLVIGRHLDRRRRKS